MDSTRASVPFCSCILTFEAASPDALEGALLPESAEAMLRARATMRREGARVVVAIEAEDVVALRAAVNSYLRAAATVEGALRATRG